MSNKKNDPADEQLDEELDDAGELEPVVHKSTRPAKLKAPMGRETKVGLVVIVALLFIFSLVLIKRLMGPPSADVAADGAAATDTETTTDDGSAVNGSAVNGSANDQTPSDMKSTLENKTAFNNKAAFDNKPNVMQAKTEKSASNDPWGNGGNSFAKQAKSSDSQSTWGGAGTAYGAKSTSPSAPTSASSFNANSATNTTQTPGAYGQLNKMADTGRSTLAEVNGNVARGATATKNNSVDSKRDLLQGGTSTLTANVVTDDSNTSPVFPRRDLSSPNSAYGAQPPASELAETKPAYGASSSSAYDTEPRSAYGAIPETSMTKNSKVDDSVKSGIAKSPPSSDPFGSRGFSSAQPATSNLASSNAARTNSALNSSPSLPTNARPSASNNTALTKSTTSRTDGMAKATSRASEAPAYGAFRDDPNELTPANDVRLQPAPASDKMARALDNSSRVNERTSMPVAAGYPTYRVKANDTYWTISERVYGTGSYFKALYEHNRLRSADADRLSAGVELQTPDAATLERLYSELSPKVERASAINSTTNSTNNSTPSSMAKRPADDLGRSYVVEEGDTLLEIARRELGKPTRWAEIYQLNRDRSGIDLDYLRPGTELILPGDSRGSLR